MGLFQNNEIKVLSEQRLNNNKTDKFKIKIVNGYDDIREKVDEGNGCIVKKQLYLKRTKPKICIGS